MSMPIGVSPKTAAVPVVLKTIKQTKSKRLLYLLPLLLFVGTGTILLIRQAWQTTELREAYLPDLETAAGRSPNDGALLVVLGGRLAQAGEFTAAADVLNRAVAAGEDRADVWQIWAAANAAAGKRAEALAVLKTGIASVHDPKEIVLLKTAQNRAVAVDSLSPLGALAQAICPLSIEEILDRRLPGSFLNDFFKWQGRRNPDQSGYATRREWAEQNPNDPQAQRLWGLALLRNRRLNTAQSVLENAVTLAPNDPDVRMAFADLLAQNGAWARAGREYQSVLKMRKDYLPALLGLGQVALDKSLIALSVSVFQKTTQIAPNSADAWVGLGRAYYSTHIQLGQSVTAFQKAVVLSPERTDFYPDYFRALRLTFQYAEAEKIIRRRLQITPDDGQSHFLLALLLRDYQPTSVREAEAESELRISLKLSPRSATTEIALAQLLLQKGKFDETISLLNDALVQDDLNVKAIQMLERAYRQAGATQIADRFRLQSTEKIRMAKRLGDLQDAEHRNPGDAETHANLGKLYATLGRTAEAEQESQFAAYLKARPASARHGIQTLDSATTISHPVTNP